MAFWSSGHAAPVRSHHFKVKWGGSSATNLVDWTVKSCTKPSIEITSGEYQVGNQIFKYPGVHKWQDVTLVYVDDKETTRRAIAQLMKMGWKTPLDSNWWDSGLAPSGDLLAKKYNHGETDGIKKGHDMVEITQHAVLSKREYGEEPREASFWRPESKGVIAMAHSGDDQETSGAGKVHENFAPFLEKWILKNAWIKSINFGQLDYSSDELINIEIVVSFDYCTVQYGTHGKEFE
jgi:hypothetical protein